MKKTKRNRAKTAEDTAAGLLQAESDNSSLWHEPFIHVLLILVTGFVVYSNTISVPFIFDDYDCLVKNPAIRNFSCFPETQRVMGLSISADVQNNVILRPVAYFTFAINYALHGLDVFGYHIVNLLLHIGCAMLVYNLSVQLMSTPAMTAGEQTGNVAEPDDVRLIALFAALLFVCHPLQTQAVTYIIQRFVPLATFFYLGAIALYVRFRTVSTLTSRVTAYALSLAATVLAMESKEIAFTLPVIIVLVECMFFTGGVGPRFVRLMPFLLTMVIIPIKLLSLTSPAQAYDPETISGAINLINFKGTSSWDYLMTQFGVITTYLRLLLLPVGQNFDYDYPLQQSFFSMSVLFPLVLLLILMGTGLYLLVRSREYRLYKLIAFGVFWFFITLSVESSIVPIEDLIFEHRIYLPSIGLFISVLTVVAVMVHRITGRSMSSSRSAALLLVASVVSLTATAISRNMVWQHPVTLWTDVTRKSPNKARGYAWLGESHLEPVMAQVAPEASNGRKISVDVRDPRIDSAIKAFREAIRLRPAMPLYYLKLGYALQLKNELEQAEAMYAKAEQIAPDNPWSSLYMADLLKGRGDLFGARKRYLHAIDLDPRLPAAHLRLADLLFEGGDIAEAVKELEYFMQIYPDEAVRKKIDRYKRRIYEANGT